MSEQDETLRASKAKSIADETIRRCLLGYAPPDEQARFEELLLVDDELDRRVRLAELELADDYSGGRLTPQERQFFTSNFLVTRERRQQLGVSQALRRVLSRRSIEARHVEGQGRTPLRLIPSLFGFDHPLASFALAFIALFFFAGLTWLVIKSPRVRQSALVKRLSIPIRAREKAHAEPPQKPQSAAPQQSTTPKPTSPLVSLILRSGGQIDDKQTVHLSSPAEGDTVRLELLLESTEPVSYGAELSTVDGQHLTDASELAAFTESQQAKVVWDVPARVLKAGDYQITLRSSSTGSLEDVAHYYFRVQN